MGTLGRRDVVDVFVVLYIATILILPVLLEGVVLRELRDLFNARPEARLEPLAPLLTRQALLHDLRQVLLYELLGRDVHLKRRATDESDQERSVRRCVHG